MRRVLRLEEGFEKVFREEKLSREKGDQDHEAD